VKSDFNIIFPIYPLSHGTVMTVSYQFDDNTNNICSNVCSSIYKL